MSKSEPKCPECGGSGVVVLLTQQQALQDLRGSEEPAGRG